MKLKKEEISLLIMLLRFEFDKLSASNYPNKTWALDDITNTIDKLNKLIE